MQNNISYYDEFSFVKKGYKIIKEPNNFNISIIDLLDLYAEENNKPSNISNITFFTRRLRPEIDAINVKNFEKNKEVLLNDDDQKIKGKIQKLKGKLFDVNQTDDNNFVIRIKDFYSSKINITLHDRCGSKKDNFNNMTTWFSIIKDGLSFEREKTLSIFFIEDFVKTILKLGHTDISIDLEMPVIKTSGNNGFIDLFIRSKYNGFNYGQFFELKAVYNFTEKLVNEATEQAQSYVITEYLDKYNINNSYSGYNFFETKMINLLDKKEQD